jgi:hypothetical protein
LPLSFATSSADLTDFKALIVAVAIFNFVREPSDLDKMSFTPASSNTARTAPPAITPVPAVAGFKNTLAAPLTPVISCWIVRPSTKGILTIFLLAA